MTNPGQALIESDKLTEAAAECQNIIDSMERLAGEIPALWEGVSANAFLQSNRRIIESMAEIRRELGNLAEDVKDLAMLP